MVDKLSLLFDLFGSDADFIEEYENILAEKLLLSKPIDINEEIKNIELLKLRFGESKMIRSTVILRDVEDSIRFDASVKEAQRKDRRRNLALGLSAENSRLLFVSCGYWPITNETTHFKLPDSVQQVFDDIHDQFKRHKQIMHLDLHNNLGSVKLELKFKNGGEYMFKCEPVQALLISLFDENNNATGGGVSLDRMAEILQSHPNYVRSKLFYWLKKGVIREVKKASNVSGSLPTMAHIGLSRAFSRGDTIQEDTIVYELVEDYMPGELPESEDDDDEVDNEQISREKLTNRDMVSSLKRYEDKIISLLSTNGSKSILKIKGLLDSVYKVDNSMINMNELSEILTSMVKRRKLIVINDVYSLCTNA